MTARMIDRCEYCGDDLGESVEKWAGEPVTCGKHECERWVREELEAEREEAHYQLDRAMGWDR